RTRLLARDRARGRERPTAADRCRCIGAAGVPRAMTMQAFLHQLASGLASGSIYASLALALVMIFKATHHVNFAQGEIAMFSTYVAYTLIKAGVAYWLAFAITLVGSFLAGLAIER